VSPIRYESIDFLDDQFRAISTPANENARADSNGPHCSGGAPEEGGQQARVDRNHGLNLRVYQGQEERAMIMTTPEIRKTLTVLERLLAALERRGSALEGDERRLLQRLHERRRALHGLIAARESEREKKIVSFAFWRDETLHVPLHEPQLGAGAIQPSHGR
jgi:hypothetical protein